MPRQPRQRPGGRRKPPQADTDMERRFLLDRRRSGQRLVIELVDGTRAEGTLREFGETSIELETDEQPARFAKSKIRYIEEV